MVEGEIWPFLRVSVTPKLEKSRPPKLVYMHVISTPTCMNFLSRFRLIKFFDDHGLYIVHGEKGKFGRFGGSSISKTGRVMPTKIGLHACYINLYMHDFFELIPMH